VRNYDTKLGDDSRRDKLANKRCRKAERQERHVRRFERGWSVKEASLILHKKVVGTMLSARPQSRKAAAGLVPKSDKMTAAALRPSSYWGKLAQHLANSCGGSLLLNSA
jgi:hypothetical protein